MIRQEKPRINQIWYEATECSELSNGYLTDRLVPLYPTSEAPSLSRGFNPVAFPQVAAMAYFMASRKVASFSPDQYLQSSWMRTDEYGMVSLVLSTRILNSFAASSIFTKTES